MNVTLMITETVDKINYLEMDDNKLAEPKLQSI